MKCMNSLPSEEIILYHGSPVIVAVPKILDPGRAMDYGSGFYCTTSKAQAQNRARTKSVNQGYGYVNVYRFYPAFSDARVLRFEAADERWVNFVEKNRRDRTFRHNYDIVIGPVADDKVNLSFSLYEDKIILKKDLIARLKAYNLVDQYLFHTERALNALVFLRAEKVLCETPTQQHKSIKQPKP